MAYQILHFRVPCSIEIRFSRDQGGKWEEICNLFMNKSSLCFQFGETTRSVRDLNLRDLLKEAKGCIDSVLDELINLLTELDYRLTLSRVLAFDQDSDEIHLHFKSNDDQQKLYSLKDELYELLIQELDIIQLSSNSKFDEIKEILDQFLWDKQQTYEEFGDYHELEMDGLENRICRLIDSIKTFKNDHHNLLTRIIDFYPEYLEFSNDSSLPAELAQKMIKKGAVIDQFSPWTESETPLIAAINNYLINIVELLINTGADADYCGAVEAADAFKDKHLFQILIDAGGTSKRSLHIYEAVAFKSIEELKKMVPSSDVKSRGKALKIATEKKLLKKIQFLLTANPGRKANNSALLVALKANVESKPHLYYDEKVELLNILKAFKEGGANFNALDGKKKAALSYAPLNEDIIKFLLSCGADANRFGRELFLEAVSEGKLKIVQLLLNTGLNPNYLEKNQDSALCLAIMKGQVEIIDLLLERDADLKHKNSNGFTNAQLLDRFNLNKAVRPNEIDKDKAKKPKPLFDIYEVPSIGVPVAYRDFPTAHNLKDFWVKTKKKGTIVIEVAGKTDPLIINYQGYRFEKRKHEYYEFAPWGDDFLGGHHYLGVFLYKDQPLYVKEILDFNVYCRDSHHQKRTSCLSQDGVCCTEIVLDHLEGKEQILADKIKREMRYLMEGKRLTSKAYPFLYSGYDEGVASHFGFGFDARESILQIDLGRMTALLKRKWESGAQ